jgi:hypothetical protein
MRILVKYLQAQKKHPLIGYEHWRRYFIDRPSLASEVHSLASSG